MSRSSPAITYEVSPDGETTADGGPDADQQRSYDDFRNDLAGAESGYVVWVFKNPEDKEGNPAHKGKLENMFTAPVDKYSMDEICQIVRDDWMDENDKKWLIRIQVREGSTIRLNKLQIVRKAGNASARTQSQMAEMMAEVRRTISEIENRVASRVAAVPTVAPQFDMLALMKFMQDSASQNMQTLAVLISALKPTNSGSNDILTMVKTMGEIKNFAGDLVPSVSDSGDSAMGTIKALSPFAVLLAEVLKKNNGDAPRVERKALPSPNAGPAVSAPDPHAVTPDAPAPQVPPAAAPATVLPAQPTEAQANMITELRTQLGALAEIAVNKPDAKEVAATLLPMLPTEMDDMIYDTLSAENWFERLTFIQPAIKPHREWMQQVRDAILESYSEVKPET